MGISRLRISSANAGRSAFSVAERDRHRVLVGVGGQPMGAEERRRQPDHVGEAAAGERLEAADRRHRAHEAELLRLGLARARCATLASWRCDRDGDRVSWAQPEPLCEGIPRDRLVDRFGIGQPSADHLHPVGVEAFGFVRRDEQDVRERHRMPAGGHGPEKQARP